MGTSTKVFRTAREPPKGPHDPVYAVDTPSLCAVAIRQVGAAVGAVELDSEP